MANIVGYIKGSGDYSHLRYIPDEYLDESPQDAELIIEESVDVLLKILAFEMKIDGVDTDGKEAVVYIDYEGLNRKIHTYAYNNTPQEKNNG